MIDKAKIMRLLISAFLFLGMTCIINMPLRESHLVIFGMGLVVLFSLFIPNIWLTLFMWLTVALFAYYGYQGIEYVICSFLGCLLYMLVRISFKRDHVEHYINLFLWFVVVNITMMIFQALGMDLIYTQQITTAGTTQISYMKNFEFIGFMGNNACMGILIAFAIPILAMRKIWLGLIMFIPLYFSKSSICYAAGVVSMIFVLYHKVDRKALIGITLALLVVGFSYIKFVDMPMGMMGSRIELWKVCVRDAMIHPISGWGLDSFRNELPHKPFVYSRDVQLVKKQLSAAVWDNPHNLYVSLFYEWGIFGLVILFGLIREATIRFRRSIKTIQVVGLFGVIITLLIVSTAQFPMFLARMIVIIIPMFALYEIITEKEGYGL
jgi:hypothetical protein